jgi:hypothetical protein
MEVNGQLHVPAALLPSKEPPVSFGGPHSRSGSGDGKRISLSEKNTEPCCLVSILAELFRLLF